MCNSQTSSINFSFKIHQELHSFICLLSVFTTLPQSTCTIFLTALPDSTPASSHWFSSQHSKLLKYEFKYLYLAWRPCVTWPCSSLASFPAHLPFFFVLQPQCPFLWSSDRLSTFLLPGVFWSWCSYAGSRLSVHEQVLSGGLPPSLNRCTKTHVTTFISSSLFLYNIYYFLKLCCS